MRCAPAKCVCVRVRCVFVSRQCGAQHLGDNMRLKTMTLLLNTFIHKWNSNQTTAHAAQQLADALNYTGKQMESTVDGVEEGVEVCVCVCAHARTHVCVPQKRVRRIMTVYGATADDERERHARLAADIDAGIRAACEDEDGKAVQLVRGAWVESHPPHTGAFQPYMSRTRALLLMP